VEAEADLIDLRVEHLAEREGISMYEAYGRFLPTAEGMRLLADLRLTQKRYDEESDLRIAAQRLGDIKAGIDAPLMLKEREPGSHPGGGAK